MKNFFKTLFTGSDNNSADIGRLLIALVVVWPMIISGYQVFWQHAPFDLVTWASAQGGLLVAGSGGLLIKSRTEPTKE